MRGRPHFLVQKTSDFSKFMVCLHGQGSLSPYGHFIDKEGGGQFFAILCGLPLLFLLLFFFSAHLYEVWLQQYGSIFWYNAFSLFSVYMIKAKVAFLEGRPFLSQSEQFKRFSQKALFGWKKVGPSKRYFCFDHVGRLFVPF